MNSRNAVVRAGLALAVCTALAATACIIAPGTQRASTATPYPTYTPYPTPTPNLEATRAYQDDMERFTAWQQELDAGYAEL